MRKADRECNDPEFFATVMSKADDVHVSFVGDDMPYVIPLNFAHFGVSTLYMHCADEGHKIDLLARDGRVGFSMCYGVEVDPAKATTYYSSVCGNGRMCVVTDVEEKMRGLTLIAEKFGSACAPKTPAATERVTVLRLDIAEIHGKHRGK